MKKFYVIGNGFDIHHGIPSSYNDFKHYIQIHDCQTYETIDTYLNYGNNFWSDFEANLSELDVDTLIQEASEFIVSFSDDNWKDSDNHGYQFRIQEVTEMLTVKLKNDFASWIRQLNIPNLEDILPKKLSIDQNSLFLNFNYTSTLEKLYNVKLDNICYIHGAAKDPTDDLIIGHSWRQSSKEFYSPDASRDEDTDFRYIEGSSIINNYFKGTFKPSSEIITKNQTFFSKLRKITNIVIIGHSMSSVDHIYFKEIIKNIDVEKVNWDITYYKSSKDLREKVKILGIPPKNIQFTQIDNLLCN